MGIWTFNVNDGYTEALARGLRQSLLTPDDYRRLGMADTLEDLRSALEETDYGSFLQDEPVPLAVTTIGLKAREKLANEFRHIRSMANSELVRFLDFIAAEKMIDNVVSLLQGAMNKKRPEEMLARVDPLGWFPEMKAVAAIDVTSGYEELYRTLLIDTPVGPYFEQYLNTVSQSGGAEQRTIADIQNILSDTDLELMRSALKKAWLEDFYDYCQHVGGSTAEVMGHILKTEADFRVLSVTLNSINTNLGNNAQLSDRNALYPAFGYLYPEGTDKIRKAWNDQTVRAALEFYPKYLAIFDDCKAYYMREGDGDNADTHAPADGLKSLEDLLYAQSIDMCEMSFEQQFHYGVFFSLIKLKEQEIRNIVWIADMISMRRKEHIDQILPIFKPRY